MTAEDAVWIEKALDAWDFTRARILEIGAPEAAIIVFDARCAFEGGVRARSWRGAPHNGEVSLPNGETVPPIVTSFATTDSAKAGVFFVMALPSVWRAQGVDSPLGLSDFLTGVLIHEMTHTAQFDAYGPQLDALERKWALPKDFSDDIVQERFASDTEYSAAYLEELTRLLQAAAAPDDTTAARLAREALAMIVARRARWFVGEHESLLDLEDVFLTLEGVGNWAAFSWLAHPAGGGRDRADAIATFGPRGKYWSQDEGAAIFLVIDRLDPSWRARAFSAEPETALALLARAAAA